MACPIPYLKNRPVGGETGTSYTFELCLDMDLDSGSLLNARRIASKSAIDLVGLNEGEVFDANAPLGGEFGGGLGMGVTGNQMQASVDNGFSFQVTMMPSRCIIVSNLSQYLDDDSVRVIFQVHPALKQTVLEWWFVDVWRYSVDSF